MKDRSKKRRKKPKHGAAGPKKLRNPFAGRPKSGAGFHEEAKYGKKDRREQKLEIDEESESSAEGTESKDG